MYRRARRAARRTAGRFTRRPAASTQVVTYVARRPAPRKSNMITRFGRGGMQKGELAHTAVKVGTAVGGAIGVSALTAAIPGITNKQKAAIATGIGLIAYVMLPRRQRMIRYAATGAAIAGGVSLAKQFVPGVPMLAGIDDINMGMNIRPRFTPDNTAQWRARMYAQNKSNMINKTISPSRNLEFMGSPGGVGAQFGQFQTPANM